MLSPDSETVHSALCHVQLSSLFLGKKILSSLIVVFGTVELKRYKITYATARTPALSMYLNILIAKLAEGWSE